MIRLRTLSQLGFTFGVVLLTVICSMNASAALIVYEGFEYADGTNLRTQTGGFGWSGAWTNTGSATETATTPGLTYPNLAVLGNKGTLAGQQTTSANGNNAFILRDTATTFGTDGTTLWLSFIGQRTGNKSAGGTPTPPSNYQRVYSLGLFNGTTEQASVGELSADTADVWCWNRDTTVANSVHTTVPLDTQVFALIRIDFGAGTNVDNAYLWLNHDLSLGEPSIGTANASFIGDDLTFNRIRMTVGGSQNSGATLAASGLFDEIRVGDTFADVLNIPEPALLQMSVMCLWGMVSAMRRRRGVALKS
jgi:hypothetical protein